MPITMSDCRIVELLTVRAPNADSARWAGVAITAVSVRRSSGSARVELSGLGGGGDRRRMLHCRIRLWL